jgi:hypothetical protein
MSFRRYSVDSLVGICNNAEAPPANSLAISPSGAQVTPYILADPGLYHEVYLPIEAYRQPGLWGLRSGNIEIYVNIPVISAPTALQQGSTFWLAGFQPFERVVAVRVDDTFSVTEIEMDANGQYLGILTGSPSDQWLVVVAEETYIPTSPDGYPEIEDPIIDYVNRTYFGGGGASSATLSNTVSSTRCTNSPAPRLVVGGRGRVIPNTSANNLRASPETGSVLASIPAGGAFDVIGTYQCGSSGGLTWWQVRYNGVTGWTAEGQGSTYWIEPI